MMGSCQAHCQRAGTLSRRRSPANSIYAISLANSRPPRQAGIDLHDGRTHGVVGEGGEPCPRVEPECVACPDSQPPPYPVARNVGHAVRKKRRDRRGRARTLTTPPMDRMEALARKPSNEANPWALAMRSTWSPPSSRTTRYAQPHPCDWADAVKEGEIPEEA